MIKQVYLFFIRLYFTVLSAVSPARAGKEAFKVFQRTRKLPFKPSEMRFYDEAKKFQVVHPRENIHAYEVGTYNTRLVILVHGWDSNAGSMGAIAKSLVENGFRVVSLDLPAHGYSSLTHTNLRECSEALRALIYQLRPSTPFSIVSHSFGSAVAAAALADTRYEVDQFIMLTSPNKLFDIFKEFKEQIYLSELAFTELLQQAEVILKEPVCNVSVEAKLSHVHYQRLTILHDIHDKVLPFVNAEQIQLNASTTTLYRLHRVGHYRMLWNNAVITKINNVIKPVETSADYLEEYVSELSLA